jgi:mRNA interferase MazF
LPEWSSIPTPGANKGGERPVLVLSTKALSLATRYAMIAPIAKTVRHWPFAVPVGSGLRVTGVVLTDQTRSVDFEACHARFLGKAPAELTEQVMVRIASIMEE